MNSLPLPRKLRINHGRRFFLVSVACFIASLLFAQERTVSFPAKEMTVREAIAVIERQQGVYFGFSTTLNPDRIVRFEKTEMGFEEAVRQTIGDDFEYTIEDKYILVYHQSLQDDPVPMFIRGKILNETDGNPVGGAFIEIAGHEASRVKSKRNGTFEISDVTEGYHIIKVTDPETDRILYREVVSEPEEGGGTKVVFREIVAPQPERVEETEADLLTIVPAQETYRTYYVPEPENEWMWNDGEFLEYAPSETEYRLRMPKVALKTNVLWWALPVANAALEVKTGKHWTADLSALYRFDSSRTKGRSLFAVQPGVRYWPRGIFEQHFWGVQGTYANYKLGHLDLPFASDLEDHYWDGNAFGLGVTGGYHFPLGKRWGLELSASVGFLYFNYDRYENPYGEKTTGRDRFYVGPTQLGVSFLYIIR